MPGVEVERMNGLVYEPASRCHNKACGAVSSEREKIEWVQDLAVGLWCRRHIVVTGKEGAGADCSHRKPGSREREDLGSHGPF